MAIAALVISIIGMIAAGYSVWLSHKADRRAEDASVRASLLERKQLDHLDMQTVNGLKDQLKPYYGNAQFKTKLKELIDLGNDIDTVLKSMELAVVESDSRVERRTWRIIDYRAELLSYVDN